jgi:AraC-like DNA-binding protein
VLKTISPSSEILKKYIDCFYFYKGETNSHFKYLAFPHYNSGLSFFRGATIERHHYQVIIKSADTHDLKIELLGKYTCPVMIDYRGELNELSIIFKPLGINRFFRNDFLAMAPKFSQELRNDNWLQFGQELKLDETDLDKLEAFLISQYSHQQDFKPLEASLKLLSDANSELSLTQIALESGYQLKTFQRHFIKHMGCTPIEYKRICRFRHSIASKLTKDEFKSLTSITYENGYYDQSYFIKEFKRLTHHNPKEFFKVANKVDGDKLIWEII